MAGAIGGLITLAGINFTNQNEQSPKKDNHIAELVNQRVNISSTTANAVPISFVDAAEKAMPVVVHISAAESDALASKRQQKNRSGDPWSDLFFGSPFGNQQKKGTGSGVIYSTDGYIVTNNHVVEFADEVEVTLYDNRKFKAAIIGTDPKTDLAVLKIDENNLPILNHADADRARVGEWVLAVGNPFDLTSTVTAGIISAKGRDINIINGKDAIEAFIQTDAAVNPGNSGGALVDANGQLLGINTAIATQTGSFAGYSFAIPVTIMKKIVNDIIEFGSYKRGFIGIDISDLDSERATELGLTISQGVVIEGLLDGGAGQYAGLLRNDVIVKVDGREVKNAPELQELVGRSKVGDKVVLTINRYGAEQEIPIYLKEAKG